MTPAKKLKMGKAIAKDLGLRYKFSQSGGVEVTLYEAIIQNKPTHGRGLGSFLMWSNPLFKEFSRGDILNLLVEKGCVEKDKVTAYGERLW